MSSKMSPLRPPAGPHKRMIIKRPKVKVEKGVKMRSCDFIDLYENLSGRVMPLDSNKETELGIENQGMDATDYRQIILTPNKPLTKIKKGDILALPWGIRPNNWSSPTVPEGLSDHVIIKTPTGNKKLKWDTVDTFVGDTISITLTNTTWTMTGDVNYTFPIDGVSFACQEFPSGYYFQKKTGPAMYFEIIKIDEQVDSSGRTAFYSLKVDDLKRSNFYSQ
jgi:hypothetical protein